MNKIRLINLILLLLLCAVPVKPQTQREAIEITYIANEGFLIKSGSNKIMFDALFGGIEGDWCDQPSDSLLQKMIKGVAPFNDINIVFVSHYHADHFSPRLMAEFLESNKSAILVCPSQVNDALSKVDNYTGISERVKYFKPDSFFDSELSCPGIKIRVVRIDHGKYYEKDAKTGEIVNRHQNVENFAYLVNMNGFNILHTGDGSPSNKEQFIKYEISKSSFDLALLDRTFLNTDGYDILEKYLNTKNLVYMHLGPGEKSIYKRMEKMPVGRYKIHIFTEPMETKRITRLKTGI